MTHRLEKQAKRASLIALIVLIGALFLNINTIGENKMDHAEYMAFKAAQLAGGNDIYGSGAVQTTAVPQQTAPTSTFQPAVSPTNVSGSLPVYRAPAYSGPTPEQIAAENARIAAEQEAARVAAEREALRQGFMNQKTSILNSANTAAQQRGLEYKQSIDRWGLGAKQAQQGLDNRGINAEMAKSQGMKGILGMVGRGIRSAGVMLANKNAGDSSAAGALANAYGDVGRRQASGVNNAYGLEQNQIGLDQQNLDAGNALSLKEFEDNKTTVVNTIVSEAENALAALDAQIAGASLPDRIAIEQEKQAIRNNAMAQLTQYDSLLAEQRAKANPIDADARRAEAARLSSLGQASNMDFGYTADVPAQFQGTGPFASELPIFTYGRNKRTA